MAYVAGGKHGGQANIGGLSLTPASENHECSTPRTRSASVRRHGDSTQDEFNRLPLSIGNRVLCKASHPSDEVPRARTCRHWERSSMSLNRRKQFPRRFPACGISQLSGFFPAFNCQMVQAQRTLSMRSALLFGNGFVVSSTAAIVSSSQTVPRSAKTSRTRTMPLHESRI